MSNSYKAPETCNTVFDKARRRSQYQRKVNEKEKEKGERQRERERERKTTELHLSY